MPSPFPGMDPYLEDHALWPDVHSSLITYIREELQAKIRPSYVARIGERIETGTFYMNRCDYLDPALPWTGVKDTGRGATLSRYGLLQLSRLKSMHLRVQLPKP